MLAQENGPISVEVNRSRGYANPPRVRFRDPGRMNLLGYFIRALIEGGDASTKRARSRARLSSLPSPVLLQAGGMRLTLAFSPDEVELTAGIAGEPELTIEGDLVSLVDAIVRRRWISSLLRGRLKVRGRRRTKSLALLKLLAPSRASRA